MDIKSLKIVAIGVRADSTDEQPVLRTCSEICIDIDNIKCIADSIRINNELFKNCKQYCLVELEFMHEYHQEKVSNSTEILNEIKEIVTGILKSSFIGESPEPGSNPE